MDPMGPSGETVLDYSVYDAIRAGFKKVIFVIRETFASDFQAHIGNKFHSLIEVEYVFQELNDLPANFKPPTERTKPWGTTHAVLAARKLIDGHFCVINADDFYGADAYQKIINHFNNQPASMEEKQQYCMVGYPLSHTLSEHGHVNRGICATKNNLLLDIEEHTEIQTDSSGQTQGFNLTGDKVSIQRNSLTSMNFWGFPKELLPHLNTYFETFLSEEGQKLTSECYLPSIIDSLIKSGKAQCHVEETSGSWFGITYPDDKNSVVQNIQQLVQKGTYPTTLFPG